MHERSVLTLTIFESIRGKEMTSLKTNHGSSSEGVKEVENPDKKYASAITANRWKEVDALFKKQIEAGELTFEQLPGTLRKLAFDRHYWHVLDWCLEHGCTWRHSVVLKDKGLEKQLRRTLGWKNEEASLQCLKSVKGVVYVPLAFVFVMDVVSSKCLAEKVALARKHQAFGEPRLWAAWGASVLAASKWGWPARKGWAQALAPHQPFEEFQSVCEEVKIAFYQFIGGEEMQDAFKQSISRIKLEAIGGATNVQSRKVKVL